MVPRANIPVAKGYQVPFARRIRDETLIKTGAVGLITEVKQADEIITGGDADLVFLGRELPARTVLGPQSPARAGRGTDVAHPIRLRRQAPRDRIKRPTDGCPWAWEASRRCSLGFSARGGASRAIDRGSRAASTASAVV